MLFDLDHFKIVNDSLGLPAGDELFAVVAQRVERVLRAGDTVARLGGDELAIVCNGRTGNAMPSSSPSACDLFWPSRSCSSRARCS